MARCTYAGSLTKEDIDRQYSECEHHSLRQLQPLSILHIQDFRQSNPGTEPCTDE